MTSSHFFCLGMGCVMDVPPLIRMISVCVRICDCGTTHTHTPLWRVQLLDPVRNLRQICIHYQLLIYSVQEIQTCSVNLATRACSVTVREAERVGMFLCVYRLFCSFQIPFNRLTNEGLMQVPCINSLTGDS